METKNTQPIVNQTSLKWRTFESPRHQDPAEKAGSRRYLQYSYLKRLYPKYIKNYINTEKVNTLVEKGQKT